MIRHFFLDKTNTIIEGRRQNFGLNPILSVAYGVKKTRGLLHFDISDIKELVSDKTINLENTKFTLKMTNCFSIIGNPYEENISQGRNQTGKRAASCDIMLIKLPCHFDAGRGFDYIDDFWVHDTRSFSNEGSTWYHSRTAIPWSMEYISDYDPNNDEGGIYSEEKLMEEYKNYLNKKESIVIGTQHFDFGNENLSIDITKYVNDCIETNTNYGLCLLFTPTYEKYKRDENQILDFFTDHTNTFFHPYIELEFNEHIKDNRDMFIIGETNRLYLYVYDNDNLTNLDITPTCSIEDVEYTVKQSTKGVYYVEVSNDSFTPDMIYYDLWDNLYLNGVKLDSVELEFVAKNKMFNKHIGYKSSIKENLTPIIYGINDNEDISNNEIREITVEFNEKYNSQKQIITKNAEYRIYVKDGNSEIDVIKYHPLEMSFLNNFFIINTNDLIPNKYFIDIKVSIGRELFVYKDILRFNIVNNVTERYQ